MICELTVNHKSPIANHQSPRGFEPIREVDIRLLMGPIMAGKYGFFGGIVALLLWGAAPVMGQVASNGEIVVTGQTEPVAKVEITSATQGQLVEVTAVEGQAIKKGDAIAKLDDAIQKLTVELKQLEANSTAEVRSAHEQVDHAQVELERYQKLGINDSELRQREINFKQAQLGLEKMGEVSQQRKVELAREKAMLDRLTIRSPLDGLVLRVNKHAGEAVDEKEVVAVVVQINKLSARFFPPKAIFGKIHNGDMVTLQLNTEPPVQRKALVVAVDPIIDTASQLFRVKLELDNADQKIPAGTTATWTWQGK
jgi:RND family efflux transporter MFP subunit